MPDPQGAEEQQLAAFWEAVVRGETPQPDDMDPDIAHLVSRVHALYRPPMPDARFRDHLRKDLLMSAAANARMPSPGGGISLVTARRATERTAGAIGTPRAAWRVATAGRRAALTTSAALLLLLLSLGSLAINWQRTSEGDAHLMQLAAISTPPMVGTPAPALPVAFVWQTTGGPDLPLTGAGLLAIDPQGNLWVPDSYANRFQIFDPDGAFLEAWGTAGSGAGQLNLVAAGFGYGAAAFDAAGNLYVADTGNYRIQKFDSHRRFITSWGSQGARDGQFLRPLNVAVDGQGRVFVGDDLRGDIQVFDRDGGYLETWGGKDAGKGRLNSPGGITFDAEDNVWVTDINSNRILQFSPEGEFLQAWGTYGSTPGELFSPQALAVDAQGRVYVAEFGNYRVQVFDSKGQLLTPQSQDQPVATWGESGRGEGQFDGVYGIVLDGAGNVYTSEVLFPRVQKFRLLPPLAP